MTSDSLRKPNCKSGRRVFAAARANARVMESNREEALRALDIARRKKAEGDIAGALKFARKSLSLFANPQTEAFLDSLADTPTSPDSTPFASGTSVPAPHGQAKTSHRKAKTHTEHRQGRQDTQYTVDQLAIVERVRKCKHHQYYEILELETKATDSEIKKSYRKLALQLHPDKNGAPGADEAFKMVSRAFQVLSDPDKRAAYDQHGDDPDSRTAGMGGSPFANGFPGMRTQYRGGGMYADEISPDELFNMFFGGAFNTGGFSPGSGPFGPGVRIHTFGGGPHRRRPAAADPGPQGNASILYQFLPILVLLLVTIIPAIFTGAPSVPAPLPSFVFETANPPYTLQRLTPQHSIPYFVNPSEINSLSKSRLRQLDNQAEVTFLRGLQHQCQAEYNIRQQKLADAQGWFGQIKDQRAWDEARTMRMGSCERLRKMGYQADVY